MLAQIKRTDTWLDDCCRPILFSIYSITFARWRFAEFVVKLEESHPEVVDVMLQHAGGMYVPDAEGMSWIY
eukprot:SAG31_NODE_38832_length_293_cov_0.716495_1_plen_70_part_01